MASVENGSEFLPDLFHKLSSTTAKMPGYFGDDPADSFREHVWINPAAIVQVSHVGPPSPDIGTFIGLTTGQYTVVTAETADEGLDAIKTHRPAAAIIDLRLRRGSGREVVVSAPPEIPVIIFSGLRSESADLETIRPNTRLVEKPYSLVMLMDTLEDMLEQSKGNASGFGRIAAS